MLRDLAEHAGFSVGRIGSCSGVVSRKLTRVLRRFGWLGRLLVLPLRVLPPLLDPPLRRLLDCPDFSVTLIARKPRLPR